MSDQTNGKTGSINNGTPCAMDITSSGEASNKVDLREISIILDGWSRTCDQILNTLDEQITKIVKRNRKAA